MNSSAFHMNAAANDYAAYKNGKNAYGNGQKTPALQRAAPAIGDAAYTIVDAAGANACNAPVNVRKIGAVHMISRSFHMDAAVSLAFSYAALTIVYAAQRSATATQAFASMA